MPTGVRLETRPRLQKATFSVLCLPFPDLSELKRMQKRMMDPRTYNNSKYHSGLAARPEKEGYSFSLALRLPVNTLFVCLHFGATGNLDSSKLSVSPPSVAKTNHGPHRVKGSRPGGEGGGGGGAVVPYQQS